MRVGRNDFASVCENTLFASVSSRNTIHICTRVFADFITTKTDGTL